MYTMCPILIINLAPIVVSFSLYSTQPSKFHCPLHAYNFTVRHRDLPDIPFTADSVSFLSTLVGLDIFLFTVAWSNPEHFIMSCGIFKIFSLVFCFVFFKKTNLYYRNSHRLLTDCKLHSLLFIQDL